MSSCSFVVPDHTPPLPSTTEIEFGATPSGHLFTVRAGVTIDETLRCANALLTTIRVLSDERCDASIEAGQALNHAIECLTDMSGALVRASLQGMQGDH